MCMGGGSDAARQAAEAEARAKADADAREARIMEGQAAIDSAFGQYDSNYYNDYASNIEAYQRSELDQQFSDARGKLTAILAQRGMLASTPGAQAFGKIGKVYADNAAMISNNAQDAANSLRGTVENQKSDLYALNRASADPTGISAQAIGSATALAAPSAVTPIGAVFEGVMNPYLAYSTARRNSAGTGYRSSAPAASGRGSSRTVGG